MSRSFPSEQRRRAVLATIGTAVTGSAIAGCTSSGGEPGATSSDATATPQPPIDHPSAVGIGDEPTLGAADPAEADAAIILFSDPSCSYCRQWHRQVWEPLKEDYLEPETVSLVYRSLPAVSPWGAQAVRAFDATYDRSAAAFWAVLDEVYSNPTEFESRTMRRIESWVAENTDADADGIVEEAAGGEHDTAVEADKRVAKNAEIESIPAYTIVREGEVYTTGTGVQSYDNVELLLGV